MRFRSYDILKSFDVVATNLSITKAAEALNQSKGAISYQINKLETELGFYLFERTKSKLVLTEAGRRLWHVSQTALNQIDQEINALRSFATDSVSVGVLTYFSSHWLSPRLTQFFESNAGISLRMVPLNSIDMLDSAGVDMAILWGTKEWQNYSSELLLPAPAFPTANYSIAQHAKEVGIAEAIQKFPLLGDSSGNDAWKAWYQAAGMDYVQSFPNLTMLDSNSRVQAVIDGQGIALWDDLISPEIDAGLLYPLSDIKLENAGYYVVFPKDELSDSAKVFLDWLKKQ